MAASVNFDTFSSTNEIFTPKYQQQQQQHEQPSMLLTLQRNYLSSYMYRYTLHIYIIYIKN